MMVAMATHTPAEDFTRRNRVTAIGEGQDSGHHIEADQCDGKIARPCLRSDIPQRKLVGYPDFAALPQLDPISRVFHAKASHWRSSKQCSPCVAQASSDDSINHDAFVSSTAAMREASHGSHALPEKSSISLPEANGTEDLKAHHILSPSSTSSSLRTSMSVGPSTRCRQDGSLASSPRVPSRPPMLRHGGSSRCSRRSPAWSCAAVSCRPHGQPTDQLLQDALLVAASLERRVRSMSPFAASCSRNTYSFGSRASFVEAQCVTTTPHHMEAFRVSIFQTEPMPK